MRPEAARYYPKNLAQSLQVLKNRNTVFADLRADSFPSLRTPIPDAAGLGRSRHMHR